MKHIDQGAAAFFNRCLAEAGLEIEADVQSSLLRYLDCLIEANQTINLTRISDPTAAIRLHLVDALLALPEVSVAPDGPLLDIGTGGGIPGVPLAVASGRKGVLLDSVAKKARAVEAIIASAQIDAELESVAGRAEELGALSREAFAVVTARAVSELPALVELAAPFLQRGGVFIALKGVPDSRELERGKAAASQCGLSQLTVRHTIVPDGGEQRTILTYEKVREPRIRLPRRIGLAQKSPLA